MNTSSSGFPSLASFSASSSEPVQMPGLQFSVSAMTLKMQDRRDFSLPMTASTLVPCAHAPVFFGPLATARVLLPAGLTASGAMSCSVPSTSQVTRTSSGSEPCPRRVAALHSPAHCASTLSPMAHMAPPATSTPPSEEICVPWGSQNVRHRVSSSMLLKFVRLAPATVATTNAGTRTFEQKSASSSGMPWASPKGPAFGTNVVRKARARRRSSGSPAMNAFLLSTSTTASEAAMIFEAIRAQAPPSPGGSSTTSRSKPKSWPRGLGGKRSEKWPGTLRSTAAMAWNLAAVLCRRSPMSTNRPCIGCRISGLFDEGRTSMGETCASAPSPPNHSTRTKPLSVNPMTLAWYHSCSNRISTVCPVAKPSSRPRSIWAWVVGGLGRTGSFS
mmetsp:Transcript_81317/g.263781  ORF Transcript_81317/g.263781 Transcript_81317/m.263781 type:complete len:388 (+) Transcript_81317:425-1588(+)